VNRLGPVRLITGEGRSWAVNLVPLSTSEPVSP
jgi:hypothetical protein